MRAALIHDRFCRASLKQRITPMRKRGLRHLRTMLLHKMPCMRQHQRRRAAVNLLRQGMHYRGAEHWVLRTNGHEAFAPPACSVSV